MLSHRHIALLFSPSSPESPPPHILPRKCPLFFIFPCATDLTCVPTKRRSHTRHPSMYSSDLPAKTWETDFFWSRAKLQRPSASKSEGGRQEEMGLLLPPEHCTTGRTKDKYTQQFLTLTALSALLDWTHVLFLGELSLFFSFFVCFWVWDRCLFGHLSFQSYTAQYLWYILFFFFLTCLSCFIAVFQSDINPLAADTGVTGFLPVLPGMCMRKNRQCLKLV